MKNSGLKKLENQLKLFSNDNIWNHKSVIQTDLLEGTVISNSVHKKSDREFFSNIHFILTLKTNHAINLSTNLECLSVLLQ